MTILRNSRRRKKVIVTIIGTEILFGLLSTSIIIRFCLFLGWTEILGNAGSDGLLEALILNLLVRLCLSIGEVVGKGQSIMRFQFRFKNIKVFFISRF